MDAGGLEERERRILGEETHVYMRDVADYVVAVVEDGEGRDGFVIHEFKGCGERLIAVDGHDVVAADVEVVQVARVKRFDGWEVSAILPEEADQAELCEDANCVYSVLFHDDYPVDPRSKYLDCFGESCGVWKGDERFFAAEAFDVFERDWLAFATFLCQFAE